MAETRLVERRVLATLEPLGQLDPDAFHELAQSSVLRALPAGGRLFGAEDVDDWTYYLLHGQVELRSGGAASTTVEAGTREARRPLAPQTPRQCTARAVTPIAFVRVPTSLLEMLLQPSLSAAVESSEVHADDQDVENRLLFEIHQDYVNDRLSIPVLPDVALRVREAVKDPDITNRRLESIASTDPSIAGRLIQVANSTAYRGVAAVATCRDAIGRLGLDTTQELVTALALKRLFQAESAVIKERMYRLWHHSTHVAAISSLLAKRKRSVNPDLALLAGLVHDIGAISVLTRAQHYPELLRESADLEQAMAHLAPQFGAMILRKWEFPDAVVTTALEVDDWFRDPGRTADCCDVVLLAQVLGFAGTPRMRACPPLSEIPAARKLGIDQVSPEECLGIIDEAGKAVDELQGSLAG